MEPSQDVTEIEIGPPNYMKSDGSADFSNDCLASLAKIKKFQEKKRYDDDPKFEKKKIGLSPLPVIVEMKVYRDSLLKM